MVQTSGLVPSIEAESRQSRRTQCGEFVPFRLGGYLSGDVRIWLRLPGDCLNSFCKSLDVLCGEIKGWSFHASASVLPALVFSYGCLVLGAGQHNPVVFHRLLQLSCHSLLSVLHYQC